MGSSSLWFLIFFSTLLLFSISDAKHSFRPHALVLPVRKDPSTLQYLTHVNQRTPLVPVDVVVDLGGQFLWVDCEKGYVSSSYRPARCGSAQCKLANSSSCGDCYSAPRPGCSNHTCGLYPDNTFARTGAGGGGELTQDVLSLSSTNGWNPGPSVTVSQFLFTCAPNFLLDGLAKNVKGMAGLGRTNISLPSQFSSAFRFKRKFAMCLTSYSTGVIFFGGGPYVLRPGRDVSRSLSYTPLIKNPVSTASIYTEGEASAEYFIGVNSIKVDENRVSLNQTLLSINKEGFGGTKISTVNPYTVMETSIYNAFTQAYIKEATSNNMTRVASVAPFEVCFSTKNLPATRVGYDVPTIDLVLQNENVVWTIFGANSMVTVNDNVVCLGFVNGGSNPRTSIVIGGYQLEDNLLQFDLEKLRLGFSSSLLFSQTTCANFDFTYSDGNRPFFGPLDWFGHRTLPWVGGLLPKPPSTLI